jgi:dihydrofolate synthase/folylpolyglutamate synthase
VPPLSPAGGQWPVVGGQRQRYALDVCGETIQVESPLVGRHQLRNVALAIAAAEELRNQGIVQITAATIAQGIRQTHWLGRFQVLPATADNPEYVLDVAHNPAGAWALRSTLSAAYRDLESGREITLVFGVMRDKAMQEITEILFPIARHVIVTHANNPRSASPDEIRQAAARVALGVAIADAENVASALTQARTIAGPSGLIAVTGSIYVVGEAMQELGASK